MIMATDIQLLKQTANDIRKDIVRMLTLAGSGHPGGSIGMADVFTTLYFNVMKHDPKNPNWEDRDRLVLSNGHICPVLYSTLAHSGYFPIDELRTLRKLNSRLQGHPHLHALPGVENSGGPLGQGISIASGIAYGAKMDKRSFKVYCCMGDGELNEGQTWEAFLFAAKFKLDNLVVVIDRNYIQIDGNTEDILPLNPLADKFKAFGFNVIEVDGNNIELLIKSFNSIVTGKPNVILANTVPGKGVSFMEGKYEWHGKTPNKDQEAIALSDLEKIELQLRGV